MSLQSFHVFFIIVSIVLVFGFSWWSFQIIGSPVVGACSVVVGLMLIMYGTWFLKKMRELPRER